MRCEKASVAKRGSRFVGLDSSRNVSEFGLVLALEEQDEQTEVMKQRSDEVTRQSKTRGRLSGERPQSQLTRRCIGNFAQNRGAARAGRGREIGRALVECFVGHQGEGEGFFGGGGDTEVVGGDDLDLRERKSFELARSRSLAGKGRSVPSGRALWMKLRPYMRG